MKQSDSIGNLASALSKAQGSMKLASKDAQNPHLRNKYADLTSVWEACRTALKDNEISVSQLPSSRYEEGQLLLVLTTILMHSSGEWISDEMSAFVVGNKGVNDLQAMGSTITYMRRYALSSFVGVATGDDDDGDSGQVTRQAPQFQQRPQPAPPVSRPIAHQLFEDFHELGQSTYGDSWDDKRPELCQKVSKGRTQRSDELTNEEITRLIDGMKAKGGNGHVTPITVTVTAPELPAVQEDWLPQVATDYQD